MSSSSPNFFFFFFLSGSSHHQCSVLLEAFRWEPGKHLCHSSAGLHLQSGWRDQHSFTAFKRLGQCCHFWRWDLPACLIFTRFFCHQLLSSVSSLGTRLHWSQTTSGDTLAVEISSYVLLAVLSVQPLTTANLGYANRIVNWLVAQQNPYGGFLLPRCLKVPNRSAIVHIWVVFNLVLVFLGHSGGSSCSVSVRHWNIQLGGLQHQHRYCTVIVCGRRSI